MVLKLADPLLVEECGVLGSQHALPKLSFQFAIPLGQRLDLAIFKRDFDC